MEYFLLSISWFFKFLGSPLLNNFILGFTGFIAVRSIKAASRSAEEGRESLERTSRVKQTADLLFTTRLDKRLDQSYQELQRLHVAADFNLRAAAEKPNSETSANLRYILNYWERVCVGLNKGIYCEEMLRESSYSTIMSVYEQAEPFIKGVRQKTGKSTYYQELEILYDRWKSDPLESKV